MGVITVAIRGSFRTHQVKEFSAMHGGHAEAVAEVIAWLANDVLPEAIAQDHQLQGEGAYPSWLTTDFGKLDIAEEEEPCQ